MGWRDPRLWIGVLIVTVSVLAGAQLVAAADDTVSVWALSSDLAEGDAVATDDLVATRVHFTDPALLAGYFTVEQTLPATLELTRGVAAGELLPRGAIGSGDASGRLQVPVAVDAALVPPAVVAGSVVDLYLSAPSSGRGSGGPALSAVSVVDAPPLSQGFAATGKRQLVLSVDEREARRFFELLSAVDTPVLTVVRRG